MPLALRWRAGDLLGRGHAPGLSHEPVLERARPVGQASPAGRHRPNAARPAGRGQGREEARLHPGGSADPTAPGRIEGEGSGRQSPSQSEPEGGRAEG